MSDQLWPIEIGKVYAPVAQVEIGSTVMAGLRPVGLDHLTVDYVTVWSDGDVSAARTVTRREFREMCRPPRPGEPEPVRYIIKLPSECSLDELNAYYREYLRRLGGAGGRPKVLHPCPHCKEQFGGRELRAHIPRCPKKGTP